MSERPEPIRAVIADDEPMARATLRGLVEEDRELELVAECKNGREAVQAVRKHAPDLLILDVQMPGMGGFEVVEALEERELPTVLFATAYDRYALRAFEVHAVDYVLKPFDDERFRIALARAKQRVRQEAALDVGQKLAGLLAAVAAGSGEWLGARTEEPGAPLRRLVIHREGRVDLVDTDDLLWVEAADQYVQLHTSDGVQLMRESMTQLERMLDPARFLRVHRSVILRLDRIRSLENLPGGGARVRLDADTWLPVSRARLGALRERLG